MNGSKRNMVVNIKRVYLPAAESDGFRVLVDRLWPRGVKKEAACVDLWAKELAPSTPLRKWFGHVPERFPEFAERYKAELAESPAAQTLLAELRRNDVLTLLYGAKDERHNNAVVLQELLRKKQG